MQDDTLEGEILPSVDVATLENLNDLVNAGERLLKKPVSMVNLETGYFEPSHKDTNEEALIRYFNYTLYVYACILFLENIVLIYIRIHICIMHKLFMNAWDGMHADLLTYLARSEEPVKLNLPIENRSPQLPNSLLFLLFSNLNLSIVTLLQNNHLCFN